MNEFWLFQFRWRLPHFGGAKGMIGSCLMTILSSAQPSLGQPSLGQPSFRPAGADLAQFERALAAQPSATKALTLWCSAHHLSEPAVITAIPVDGPPEAEPSDLRARLAAADEVPLAYRHVRLTCGTQVLSEAYNWYVPQRLTLAMNHLLTTTHKPFGAVVAPLHFSRQPLAEREGPMMPCSADSVLVHRALLRLPDGTPLALVVECYTRANFAGNVQR